MLASIEDKQRDHLRGHRAAAGQSRSSTWITKYGPWAVVTGASDGIGREIARELARRGLDLLLIARRAETLETLATELADAHGVAAKALPLDLGDPEAVDAVIEATRSLDVGLLVAAAGFGTSGDFLRNSLPRELNMMEVNCRAVVALSHHFGGRFAARRRGGIVLMSSLLAFQGTPRSAVYAATKAFIQTFAEGLRAELRPLGVDVLASAPGPVRSGFERRADMRMSMGSKPSVVARKTLSALGSKGTVRPSLLSKLLEASLMPLPRRERTRIMGAIMGGMTKHQHGNTES